MNIVDIGLAFLEGLALIVSPCILPVLPLVLAASVEGGRRRPYGIIIGFVLAFSLFALVSRQIVQALGIDLDIIKNASLVLLALFGLVLLSAKLSDKFSALTQGAANFGIQLAAGGGDGLFSGVSVASYITNGRPSMEPAESIAQGLFEGGLGPVAEEVLFRGSGGGGLKALLPVEGEMDQGASPFQAEALPEVAFHEVVEAGLDVGSEAAPVGVGMLQEVAFEEVDEKFLGQILRLLV